MKAKSSAFYQREFRKRLREQGLVKKEVWIRPEYSKQLSQLEKQLRQSSGWERSRGDEIMAEKHPVWTTRSLHQSLCTEALFSDQHAGIELIEGSEPTIHITMREFGDLPVFLTVSGEQIVAEAVLWSTKDVRDMDRFNEVILRTHKYFPLSTISLDTVRDGLDYYRMFGALSSTSLLSNVVFEIEMLALNVIQATEAYSEFLNVAIEA